MQLVLTRASAQVLAGLVQFEETSQGLARFGASALWRTVPDLVEDGMCQPSGEILAESTHGLPPQTT
jgi:hypothetical protein